jgi:hypothetical protein
VGNAHDRLRSDSIPSTILSIDRERKGISGAGPNARARELFQWHRDGQAAFGVFHPPTDHGDAAVAASQRWIAEHVAVANPVEQMAEPWPELQRR